MSNTIKIIKRRESLSNIIPSMILEIIQEHISNYVKLNEITKYKVEIGYIEESATINIDENFIETADRTLLMTYQAKIIEAYLLDHYKIKAAENKIYLKTRVRSFISKRQVVQLFMSTYGEMTFGAVGMITGKVDHATISNSRKQVCRKIRSEPTFKKEMFILDRTLCNKFGIESKLFDINGTLLIDLKKNRSK